MPAGYWWAPVDGINSTTVVDWLKGPGIPHARYTVYEYAPRQGDDMHFAGAVSQSDCVIPPYGGGQLMPPPPSPPGGGYGPPPTQPGDVFNSIRLEGGYAGSVELARDLQVNVLEVGSGDIAQKYTYDLTASNNTHAGDLTVSGNFLWTGGGIQHGPRAPLHNGLIVPGTIALAPTATGIAEPSFTNPGINGTVVLGSVLTLKGNNSALGSTLDVLEGTFKLLNNDASFVVENNSLISFKAPAKLRNTTPGKITIDGDSKTGPIKEALTIKEGGKGVVKAKDRTGANIAPAELEFTGKGSSLRNSGELVILDKAWVIFDEKDEQKLGGLIQNSGDAPLDPDGPPPTQNQKTLIEADCRITCKGLSAVSITSGSLVMTEVSGEAVQPDIRIQGSLAADVPYALRIYGAAKIQVPEDRRKPITLQIDGLLDWAGEIELYADHTAYKNDQVFASGRIVIEKAPPPPLIPPVVPALAVDAKLTVKWFDATQGGLVSTEGVWTLIKSTYSLPEGTQGPQQLPISATPKFVYPPDVNSSRATIGMTPDSDKIQMKLEPAD